MNANNVCVFLFDGFSDWEIAYVAPELKKSRPISLTYFTMDGLPVTSMGGLRVIPDLSLEQLSVDSISMLLLPGGTIWEGDGIREIDQLVRELYTKHKTIAAICAATTYLGRKGYLDNVKHTSNGLEYLKSMASNYKGEENYQSDFSVTDQNIITANGIAPIEFAREIFKKIELYNQVELEKWFQLFKNGIWTE